MPSVAGAPAYVNQRAVWGNQQAVGLAVAATDKFRASNVTMSPEYQVEFVRPSGSRVKSTNYVTKSWSEGDLDGVPCWNELPGFFNWALGSSVDPGDGTGEGTQRWTITNALNYRTVEFGEEGTGKCAQVSNVFVKNFELKWSRGAGDANVKAGLVGGAWLDSQNMSTGTTALPVRPITGTTVRCFLSSDPDTNPYEIDLSDALEINISTGDMRHDVWSLDGYPSWKDTVDVALESFEVSLMMKATSVGREFAQYLAGSDTMYLQIMASGGDGETLELRFAVQPNDYSLSDQDDVYAVEVPLSVVEDSTGFSHYFQISPATS